MPFWYLFLGRNSMRGLLRLLGRPRYERKCPRSHDKLPKAHFYGKSNLPSFVENELNMQRQQGLYLVSLVIWDLLYLV